MSSEAAVVQPLSSHRVRVLWVATHEASGIIHGRLNRRRQRASHLRVLWVATVQERGKERRKKKRIKTAKWAPHDLTYYI